jgi:hypothetical protein
MICPECKQPTEGRDECPSCGEFVGDLVSLTRRPSWLRRVNDATRNAEIPDLTAAQLDDLAKRHAA